MIEHIINRKNYLIEIFLDIIIFGFSYIIAFYLRLDGAISTETSIIIKNTLPVVVLIRTIIFFMLKVFSGQWQYSSMPDVLPIIKATLSV